MSRFATASCSRSLLVLCAFGLGAALACRKTRAPPLPSAFVAWVPTVARTNPPLADSLARVPRSAAAESTTTANLYAARGEVEGFSIVVKAPSSGPITRLSLRTTDLVGPQGKKIPADRVEAYRAMYQRVTKPTGSGQHMVRYYKPSQEHGPAGAGTMTDPGYGSMCGRRRPYGREPCYIPDGLIPYKKCKDGSAPPCPGDPGMPNSCPIDGSGCGERPPSMVVSNTDCDGPCNQELWVEITVPRGSLGCPAGVYRGTLTVSSNAGGAEIPIALTVWDFELPVAPSFKTGFGSDTSPQPGGYGWVTNEQDYLAKHKVSSVHYGTFDDGGPRAWALKGKWGVPNVTGAGFWPGVSLGRCARASDYPARPQIEGWISGHAVPPDVEVYVADGDEIWKEEQEYCGGSMYAAIRAGARIAHATRAKVQSTVNPIDELSYQNEDGSGPPAVDIFVAGPEQLFRESPRNRLRAPGQPDIVSKVLDAGSEIWTYNIWLGDSWGPKWQLDYSPVSYRMGFIAQALRISGAWIAEYWTLSGAGDDPWVDGVYLCPEPPSKKSCPMNGDSQFIYPGAPVGLGATPVPHLRLKFFRDGIEDYELVQILKTISGGAGYRTGACPGYAMTCRAVVESLGGTDYSDYSTDTHALQRARLAIGAQIAGDPHRPTGNQ